MTVLELQAGLPDIEGGGKLDNIRYASGAAISECMLERGVVPASSGLAGEGISTYVATGDSIGDPSDRPVRLATVAVLRAEGSDEAVVGIDTDSENGAFVRKLLTTVLRRNDVRLGVLDASRVSVSTQVLEAAGLRPQAEGSELYQIAA